MRISSTFVMLRCYVMLRCNRNVTSLCNVRDEFVDVRSAAAIDGLPLYQRQTNGWMNTWLASVVERILPLFQIPLSQ